MLYFKDQNDGFYAVESMDVKVPEGCFQITQEEADAHIEKPKGPSIQAQIDALESAQLLPRITREFMLAAAQAQAAAAGVDPMMNVGYAKLKQFDELIASLRDKL